MCRYVEVHWLRCVGVSGVVGSKPARFTKNSERRGTGNYVIKIRFPGKETGSPVSGLCLAQIEHSTQRFRWHLVHVSLEGSEVGQKLDIGLPCTL